MTMITTWKHGAAEGHPAALNKYWGSPAARAQLLPQIRSGPHCVSDGHPPDCIRPIHLPREADQVIAVGRREAEQDLLAQAVVLRNVVMANPFHDAGCWLLDGYTYERTATDHRHLWPDLSEADPESELRASPLPPAQIERLHGACWGALVGDALGVPAEFRSRKDLRRNPITAMVGGGAHQQQAGTWSDDGALILATLAVLGQGYGPLALLAAFSRWLNEAAYTATGEVFDVGGATRTAIERFDADATCLVAPADESQNGNGALLRILPVALWYAARSDEERAERIAEAAQTTHGHPRSTWCCQFLAVLAVELLKGEDFYRAYGHALNRTSGLLPATEVGSLRRILDGSILCAGEDEVQSSGYVVHTLEAALWCLHRHRTYEAAVLAAVNLGEDSDTTACVVGGLAGLRSGIAAVPAAWRSALQNRTLAASIIEPALARMVTGWRRP